MNLDDRNSAHYLGVPDGARVYYPNFEDGIGYTYNVSLDKWISDNNSWCGRECSFNTGSFNTDRDKYYLLTAQYLVKASKKLK
jgi:hypothetical protein